MTDPAEKKRRATYQDVLDAPAHKVAEIIAGTLHLSPRPKGPATSVGSTIGVELGPPFSRGKGGPGGWIILDEPELHIEQDVVVPDLAGWRRDRMPVVPDDHFSIVPDWICEVLSPSTERFDRAEKLPLFATWSVRHAWLVHPRHRTLEVFRLRDSRWELLGVHKDDARVRVEPFDAIELDLSVWWSDIPLRASEPAAEYGATAH